MGIVQKDAFRTTIISFAGIALGYLNKGVLFLLILSAEQIGLVNLLITFGTLFAQIAGFGTVFTTLKFLPFFKNEEKQHYGFLPFITRIIIWGSLFTTIAFILFKSKIFSSYKENAPEFISYYWWVLPIGIGYVFYLLFEAYLRSFYKNVVSLLSYEILLRALVSVTLVLYALHVLNFDWFVKFNSLIYLVPPIVLLIYMKGNKSLHIRPKEISISKRFRQLMVKFSAYNYVNSLGIVLVVSLDNMMIAQMLGLDATGVYSTVVFIASALLVPYRSINRVSSPLVAEYWKNRKMNEMQQLYVKSASVSLFIGLACFIIIWLNIDLIFSFLKPEFVAGIWVFFTLMIGRFFEMFFGLTGVIFNTSKKYKYDIYFTIALVAIVYGLNLLFIPQWGIVGASISTAIALAVYNVSRFIFIYKAYRLNPFEIKQFIVLGLGVLTILVGAYAGQATENLWLRAIVVSMIYLLMFILPVFWFKLEPQTIEYVKKGTQFLKSKFQK